MRVPEHPHRPAGSSYCLLRVLSAASSKVAAACSGVFDPETMLENRSLMLRSPSRSAHRAFAGVAFELSAAVKNALLISLRLESAALMPSALFGIHPVSP